jgi:histidinol-phosphate aminotransferase
MLFRVGEPLQSFISAMRQRGILVRDRSSDSGCAGCVRITLGSAPDNARLFAALGEVLAQIGLSEKVKA